MIFRVVVSGLAVFLALTTLFRATYLRRKKHATRP